MGGIMLIPSYKPWQWRRLVNQRHPTQRLRHNTKRDERWQQQQRRWVHISEQSYFAYHGVGTFDEACATHRSQSLQTQTGYNADTLLTLSNADHMIWQKNWVADRLWHAPRKPSVTIRTYFQKPPDMLEFLTWSLWCAGIRGDEKKSLNRMFEAGLGGSCICFGARSQPKTHESSETFSFINSWLDDISPRIRHQEWIVLAYVDIPCDVGTMSLAETSCKDGGDFLSCLTCSFNTSTRGQCSDIVSCRPGNTWSFQVFEYDEHDS